MQATHSSSRILLPVKPWFITVSLFLALLTNLTPLGRLPGVPDWVALVLVFWSVREPQRVGLSWAFILGLFMDVADASLMGQHSLAYILASYGATYLSRRILWFPLTQQAMHLFPIFLGMQLVSLLIRLSSGAAFPGWTYFLGCISEVIVWAPLTYLLLMPQFQPVEKDETRPI